MSVKINLEYEDYYTNLSKALGIKKSNTFNDWEKSQLVIKYSSFSSFADLKNALKNANCDFKKNIQYYITHFSGGFYDYVLWIERNGIITATYDCEDDPLLVDKLFKKIENSANKKCFFNSEKQRNMYLKSLTKEETIVIEPIPEYTFPTIFTDTSILKYALKNSNVSAQVKGDNFEFTLDGFSASIYKTVGNNYEFKIVGKCNLEKIHEYFNKIETEYNKIVQYNICENIKNKVKKSPTMHLEQEEVLEDNSVLLTIRV